jgi:hypothetical protein
MHHPDERPDGPVSSGRCQRLLLRLDAFRTGEHAADVREPLHVVLGKHGGDVVNGLLLKWAFDTLDLNRVQAEVDTRNAASARVVEKLDFIRRRDAPRGLCRERRCLGLAGLRLLRRDRRPSPVARRPSPGAWRE